MSGELAQAYGEAGYDVVERGSSLVIDTPNPDPTGDPYFHGENPHTVGFGSRGAAAERIHPEVRSVSPGESTADAQNRSEGLGWNESAGAPATTTSTEVSSDPSESWRNQDLRDYAEQNGVEVSSNATKAELLEAIRNHAG